MTGAVLGPGSSHRGRCHVMEDKHNCYCYNGQRIMSELAGLLYIRGMCRIQCGPGLSFVAPGVLRIMGEVMFILKTPHVMLA